MNDKEMIVKVKNVTEGSSKYVVARLDHNELWYWGRWDTQKEAERVAEEVDGVVLFDETAQAKKPKMVCPHCHKRELTDFDIFMNFCPLCMKSLKE